MDTGISFMLKLLGAVAGDEKMPVQHSDVDWQKIYEISKKHSVTNIIGYGISKGGYDVSEPLKATFKKSVFTQIIVSENQDKEISELLKSFNENDIDYLCLKGGGLKKLYASPDMRKMSDADILIKPEQYDLIHSVMTEAGYEFMGESNHEYIYHKAPIMHVELHKYMVPTYNDDLYSYYGDGWKLAKKNPDKNSEYYLGVNDDFIYNVTHFAKHYRDGGIGIKTVIDIWLYIKKNKIDFEYVNKQFELLGILDFFNNTLRLINVWFEGGNSDKLVDDMTEFILDSGEFGRKQNSLNAQKIRENRDEDFSKIARNKYNKLIFPELDVMKSSFPVLEKAPYLLPFLWIYRAGRYLLVKHSNISDDIQRFEGVTAENLSEYDAHMKRVGLDIHNGRTE